MAGDELQRGHPVDELVGGVAGHAAPGRSRGPRRCSAAGDAPDLLLGGGERGRGLLQLGGGGLRRRPAAPVRVSRASLNCSVTTSSSWPRAATSSAASAEVAGAACAGTVVNSTPTTPRGRGAPARRGPDGARAAGGGSEGSAAEGGRHDAAALRFSPRPPTGLADGFGREIARRDELAVVRATPQCCPGSPVRRPCDDRLDGVRRVVTQAVTERPDGHTDRKGRYPAVTMTEMLFVGFFRHHGDAPSPYARGAGLPVTGAAGAPCRRYRPPVTRSRYDVVVVGGGHNGLVAAAYLARAGRSVLVLERRPRSAARRSAGRCSTASTSGCPPTPTWSACCPTGSSPTSAWRSGWPTAPSPPTRRPRGTAARPDCWSSATRARPPRRPSGSSPAPTTSSPAGSASTAGWPRWPRTSRPPSPSRCCPPTTSPAGCATPSCGTTCASGRWPTSSPTTSPTTSSAAIALTDGLIGTFADVHAADGLAGRCFLYHLVGNGTGRWRVPVGGMGAVTGAMAAAARRNGAELVTRATVTALDPRRGRRHRALDRRGRRRAGRRRRPRRLRRRPERARRAHRRGPRPAARRGRS